MKTRQFVFELGCEELPTSALPSLNQHADDSDEWGRFGGLAERGRFEGSWWQSCWLGQLTGGWDAASDGISGGGCGDSHTGSSLG